MSKDLLTAKLQTLKEVVTPLFTITEKETGKFEFRTNDDTFESDDNPFGKFVTARTKYSITLKGMGAIMLLLDTAKIKNLEAIAPDSNALYSSLDFATLRKYVQDHDDIDVSKMRLQCIGHVNIVDRDTGKPMLNTSNYVGDRAYFRRLREIKTLVITDKTYDASDDYAEARRELIESGLRANGDAEDYARRPIFVIR